MTEDILPGMPEAPEAISEIHECDCDAKLADLVAAVSLQSSHIEEQTQKVTELISAVNTIGNMVQGIMDNANGFFGQFKGLNPMDMLKGLVSGKR